MNCKIFISKEKIKLFVVLILTFFFTLINYVISNLYIDFFVMILFVLFFVIVYNHMPNLLLKYFWFVLMTVWSVVAVFMLENGDIILRGKHSEHHGSLPVYAMGWLICYFTIVCKESKNNHYKINYDIDLFINNAKAFKTIKYISFCLILLAIVCFSSIVTKPYFRYGVDRFVYKSEYLPLIVAYSMEILTSFIPIPLMLWKRNRIIPLLYLGLYLLINIWCGEKFTGLIIAFYFILLSFTPQKISILLKKYIKKIIKICVVVIIGLLFVVLSQQIILGIGFDNMYNYFKNRIAAQGELWWLMYSKDAQYGFHLNEIMDEISVLISQPTSQDMTTYDFGIYKLMKKFMFADWVNAALSSGVRATESTRATFFYYGKTIGLMVGQIVLGTGMFHAVDSVVKSINEKNLVRVFLHLYLLRAILSVSIMSDFHLLTSKRMILVYVLLAITYKKKFIIK